MITGAVEDYLDGGLESHLDHMEIFQLTCQISKSPDCGSTEEEAGPCPAPHSGTAAGSTGQL